MIKLKDLITEGKPKAGDYVKTAYGIAQINKIRRTIAYMTLPDKGKWLNDIKHLKPTGKKEKGKTLWTEGILTEGKITSDVDRAAKKHGIKFKKKVKTKITNDFTGPNEKPEKVKYDDWMDYNPQNYESQGRALISALDGKYVRMKSLKYHNGGGMIFRKDRKDKKTEFMITYARAFSGPYISYNGVKGQ